MKEANKNNLVNLSIQQLENNSLSLKDAEDAFFSIMFNILGEQGYNFHHAPAMGEDGVDFIGEKTDLEVSEKIGVCYKYYQRSVGADTVQRITNEKLVKEFDRLFIVTNSIFTIAARNMIEKIQPLSVELIDIDSLRSWVDRLQKTDKYDFAIVNIIRKELSDRLVKLIAKDPKYLLEIEWRELERVVQVVFEEIGFSSEITPGSKDGGKDVVLKCKVNNIEHTYFIELKHWRSGQRVGGSATKEFLKVIVNEQINGGLFLSTYGFCDNAFEMLTTIERQSLKFGDELKLVSLCKQYTKSKEGIWSPTECLIETLFEGTV